MESYTEAVEAFITEATWLTNLHRPAVVELKSIARQLDEDDTNVSKLREFRQCWRELLQGGGEGTSVGDEAEEFLRNL